MRHASLLIPICLLTLKSVTYIKTAVESERDIASAVYAYYSNLPLPDVKPKEL